MSIHTIGKEIYLRRKAVGLTQQHLANLANLSRQTIQRLEAGTIKDLSFQRLTKIMGIVGLSFDLPSLAARKRKNGLWMAAKTSSVSYKKEMSVEALQHALSTGEVPRGYEAQMLHFLDEAPVQIVVMAVEEAAMISHESPTKVWSHLAKLGPVLGAERKEVWG